MQTGTVRRNNKRYLNQHFFMKKITISALAAISSFYGSVHAQVIGPIIETYDISVQKLETVAHGFPGHAHSNATFEIKIGSTPVSKTFLADTNEIQSYTFPVIFGYPGMPAPSKTFKVSYPYPASLNSGYYPLPATIGGQTVILATDPGMTNTAPSAQYGYSVVVERTGTYHYTFTTTRFECYWCPPITPTSGTAHIPMENKSIPALYPNPGNGYADLVYKAAEQEKLTVRITDINGKVISMYTTDLQTGANRLPVDIRNAASGHYFVSWQSNSGNSGTLKMIKE